MFCVKCGTENQENTFRCTSCGFELHRAAPPPPPVADSGMGTFFPPNATAITAYYLGVFAVIPILGILLGIPAFFLGLKGRKYAIEHPEARGGIHAWVGILLGGVFGFGYLILVLALWAPWKR